MADVIMGFQRAIYGAVTVTATVDGATRQVAVLLPVSVGWLAVLLGAVAAGSLVVLTVTWRSFFHMSGDFAEEL
jgi:hypothetical protein